MSYKKSLSNFFKKPIFAQIVVLVVLVGITLIFKLSFNLPGGNRANVATLAINFETEKRLFEGEVIGNMTILDALSLAVSVGKIELNFSIDDSGNVNIIKIDGQAVGTGDKYFAFYLNSNKVESKDINKKIIRGGDKIEIRFQ